MCCRARSGYDPAKGGMIDFFDGENRSGALMIGLGPRYTRAAYLALRGRGSLPTGVTLRVAVDSKVRSTTQTSPRRRSPVHGKDTPILRPCRSPRPSLPPLALRQFHETGMVMLDTAPKSRRKLFGIGPPVG